MGWHAPIVCGIDSVYQFTGSTGTLTLTNRCIHGGGIFRLFLFLCDLLQNTVHSIYPPPATILYIRKRPLTVYETLLHLMAQPVPLAKSSITQQQGEITVSPSERMSSVNIPATLQWHRDQKRTATGYQFQRPEIPGDYAGGGPITGPGSVPPQPPGTEKFTDLSYPIIGPWFTTIAIAVVLFGYVTRHKK